MERVLSGLGTAVDKMRLSGLSQKQLVPLAILSLGLLYVAWTVTKNLIFSPLKQFPGPKIAALTRWWDVYHTVKCMYRHKGLKQNVDSTSR